MKKIYVGNIPYDSTEEDGKKINATLNGTVFKGKALTVAEARPQQKRQGFGSRGPGYGGGSTGKGWR
jgi:RNA recognition motif-containing protein